MGEISVIKQDSLYHGYIAYLRFRNVQEAFLKRRDGFTKGVVAATLALVLNGARFVGVADCS